jgi:hypothetical protein
MALMHRPTRQHKHLVEKIATKTARSPRKPGRRTKRWKKWTESYKGLVQG